MRPAPPPLDRSGRPAGPLTWLLVALLVVQGPLAGAALYLDAAGPGPGGLVVVEGYSPASAWAQPGDLCQDPPLSKDSRASFPRQFRWGAPKCRALFAAQVRRPWTKSFALATPLLLPLPCLGNPTANPRALHLPAPALSLRQLRTVVLLI